MKQKPRLGVLIGGPSREHEVSQASAAQALAVIDASRFTIIPLLISQDLRWLMHPSAEMYHLSQPSQVLTHEEAMNRLPYLIDVALIMMHGEFGEDGQLQRILDAATIPYQGSGVRASRLAFDKHASSQLFKRLGFSVPEYTLITRPHWVSARARIIRQITAAFGWPVVVKPNAAGSSIGVVLCHTPAELTDVLEQGSLEYGDVIVQRYERGVELTCGVLETEAGPIALPVTMIRPRHATFFDYQAKYSEGETDELTPAPISPAIEAAVKRAALLAHKALGCRDYSRTDFILGRRRLWVLETNSLPGLTGVSLLPQAAAVAGYSYAALIDHLIARALTRPEVVELQRYER